MALMSTGAKKNLHDLVDALPDSEVQAARRYLEYLRDQTDPYAYLDAGEPFEGMSDEELARLDATIAQSERELQAGHGIPAEEVLRELRAR